MLKHFRGGYKYQLTNSYVYELTNEGLNTLVDNDWIDIRPEINGTNQWWIHIKKGYAWDGPSGPTYDTDNFMEGSLVHDALYQLMREGQLAPENRQRADLLLYKLCRRDGMSWLRAKMVYHAVQIFGKKNATPKPKKKKINIG
jgi:hypothetical protein